MPVPRSTAGARLRRTAPSVSQKPLILLDDKLAVFRGFEIGDDLGEAEEPHRDADDAEAVGELRNAEVEARDARIDVGADDAEQQPEDDHRNRLDQRAVREHDGTDQAQHHQREIFGRAELQRELGQRDRNGGDEHRRDAAGEERPERRDGERGTGLPLRAIW